MHVHIIAVGKLKEKYLVQGIAEYAKRLSRYAKIQMSEVDDEKAPDSLSLADANIVKAKEGARITALIKPDSHVIALAVGGHSWSSEQLSTHMETCSTYGNSHITFIIGGSLGLSDEVLKRADKLLSFGALTFPHQLMRLMLLEQVYRAYKIMKREPYHK